MQPLSKQQSWQGAGLLVGRLTYESASQRRDAAVAQPLHEHSHPGRVAARQARKLGAAQSKHPDGRPRCGLQSCSLDAVACRRSAWPRVDGCSCMPLLIACLAPDEPCRSCPCCDCRRWTYGFDAGRAAVTAANTLRRARACAGTAYTSSGQRWVSVFFLKTWGNVNICTCMTVPGCVTTAHSTCAAPRLQRASESSYRMQAHYINHRSMEVFRSMGGDLAAQVVRRSPPLDQWRSFVYCESVTGRLLGSVDHFPVSRVTLFFPTARLTVSIAVSMGYGQVH